jgi:hypothetical protein
MAYSECQLQRRATIYFADMVYIDRMFFIAQQRFDSVDIALFDGQCKKTLLFLKNSNGRKKKKKKSTRSKKKTNFAKRIRRK